MPPKDQGVAYWDAHQRYRAQHVMAAANLPLADNKKIGQHYIGPLPMDAADPRLLWADYDSWPQDEFHMDGLTKVGTRVWATYAAIASFHTQFPYSLSYTESAKVHHVPRRGTSSTRPWSVSQSPSTSPQTAVCAWRSGSPTHRGSAKVC